MRKIIDATRGSVWFTVIYLNEAFIRLKLKMIQKKKHHLNIRTRVMNGEEWS